MPKSKYAASFKQIFASLEQAETAIRLASKLLAASNCQKHLDDTDEFTEVLATLAEMTERVTDFSASVEVQLEYDKQEADAFCNGDDVTFCIDTLKGRINAMPQNTPEAYTLKHQFDRYLKGDLTHAEICTFITPYFSERFTSMPVKRIAKVTAQLLPSPNALPQRVYQCVTEHENLPTLLAEIAKDFNFSVSYLLPAGQTRLLHNALITEFFAQRTTQVLRFIVKPIDYRIFD